MRFFIAATTALVLPIGLCCHSHGPSTRSLVFNLSMSAFTVEGHQVEVSYSQSLYTEHGVWGTYSGFVAEPAQCL